MDGRIWGVLVWAAASIFILMYITGESEGPAPAHRCRTPCINGRLVVGECRCECDAGFRGTECDEKIPASSTGANAGGGAGRDGDSVNAHQQSERDKVLQDFPYLQYAPEGEQACIDANAVWASRIRDAYQGSPDVIEGREGLHLFFTTDCTRHSLWQASTLENTWAQVKHPGALTRIVSGCFSFTGAAHQNTELMKRSIIDSKKFFIFFGPRVGSSLKSRRNVVCSATETGWYEGTIHLDSTTESVDECKTVCSKERECTSYNYRHSDKRCHMFKDRKTYHPADDHSTGTCTGEAFGGAQMPSYLADYSPINRPATALYWLYHANPRERVLGLLDPDMVFLRPLLWHIEGPQIVERGRPVGQFYDYLVTQDWDKHYTTVCKDAVCKPLGNKKDFAPGPPHLMHRQDWLDLAPWWLRYTVEVRRLWRAWTSEMAGMSIGLARLGLRSRLEDHGMWDRVNPAIKELRKLKLLDKSPDNAGWHHCAREGEICEIPDGERKVMYGQEGSKESVTRMASGNVLCSHSSNDLGKGLFVEEGDPFPGKEKGCYYFKSETGGEEDKPHGAHIADWTYCSDENNKCRLPTHDSYTVRFGLTPLDATAEKTGVAGGTEVNCGIHATDVNAFQVDPAPGTAGKQCYYLQEAGLQSPPTLRRYFPESSMPCLFHYCFTLESNKREHPESLWLTATPQRKWENDHGRPLLEYMHWSKYRSFTDWPGNDRAHTILECDKPLLFQFPPLPIMAGKYAKGMEDKGWQVFFALVPPAINDAMVKYRLKYCDDKQSINYRKIVRTAHDRYWHSKYECIADKTNPLGYSFIEAPDYGWS